MSTLIRHHFGAYIMPASIFFASVTVLIGALR